MRSLQVFRTPVGGLFRHVRDLARGLTALDHEIGIVCDSSTGGPAAEQALAALAPYCRLGIHRLPIGRMPGLADVEAASAIARIAARVRPEILHGHGAKGGVYARLAGARLKIPSLYTPHGGSLHYAWSSPRGALFLGAEKLMLRRGSGLLFVCDYERRVFEEKIGLGGLPWRVVHNGLWPEEFAAVPLAPEARDLVFLGEMRQLKGVSDLLEALSLLSDWRQVSATLVGDGPERPEFEALAQRLGLIERVRFTGALPAREAFGLGQVLVMPSRAESLPYVILEAVAAGKPLIATDVGGIPEILPAEILSPPSDPESPGGGHQEEPLSRRGTHEASPRSRRCGQNPVLGRGHVRQDRRFL
ncbi:glycosyltransferase family 4 protein [Nordella sp. HKS 07]|uniref:glycosyltransferase family 4 protein n=1 Tax=Nordella sp. HKS 07 TaxID=2712222 RepID=UPI0013E1A7D4|nr:glycosyltransferase family 4 protein [Nordella sp. HKS 07]QIG50924.1 glycosyltransferase family 4 protein [Nordella sp. HKS 07]